MYFTHHFARQETLSRAQTWLTRLGFEPRPAEMQTSSIPRIVLVVEPHHLDAVNLLINAVERADPDGFPSFWHEASQPHSIPKESPEGSPAEGQGPRASVVGWHPLD